MTSAAEKRIECDDIEPRIKEYEARGYRLDMIFPADDPREALLSDGGKVVRLVLGDGWREGEKPKATEGTWIRGRAGMEYRDLVPDRMAGRMITSHIRLTEGGEVPDYVHYHKADLQIIYCIKGRIRVVYEDQGDPFWLEVGDWVLQPPEIRHRVLECSAGSEVIEVTMPAEHETWIDHDMVLPTGRLDPDREFGGVRFVHRRGKR